MTNSIPERQVNRTLSLKHQSPPYKHDGLVSTEHDRPTKVATIQTAKTEKANQQYDIAVFIGRFQPFHKGHYQVIAQALKIAKTCVVLVGSANEARSIRNPFTTSERIGMIRKAFLEVDDQRLRLEAMEDSNYNLNEWIENCQSTVQRIAGETGFTKPKITLIGHTKDATSYYLNLFPKWDATEVANNEQINATNIREHIFPLSVIPMEDFSKVREQANNEATTWLSQERNRDQWHLPPSTIDFLQRFIPSEPLQNDAGAWNKIMIERQFVQKYQASWSTTPYPVTFVTADTVVVQSGHVLVVKRQGFPGHGLWALPGGFIDHQESIEESALRELREETGIKVPKAVLKGHIVTSKVFDAPFRSSRGRTITTAFLIHLEPGELPKIKAKDKDGEVANTAWVPLAALKREDFFEDHYSIIQNLVHQI